MGDFVIFTTEIKFLTRVQMLWPPAQVTLFCHFCPATVSSCYDSIFIKSAPLKTAVWAVEHIGTSAGPWRVFFFFCGPCRAGEISDGSSALFHVSGCEGEPWDSGGSSPKCCSSSCTKGSISLLFFIVFLCKWVCIGGVGGAAPKMWDGICVRL